MGAAARRISKTAVNSRQLLLFLLSRRLKKPRASSSFRWRLPTLCHHHPPTEAACIGCEYVLVLLRDDGLAVLLLKLALPPLQFLNHPRGEMNLPIQIFDSREAGLFGGEGGAKCEAERK